MCVWRVNSRISTSFFFFFFFFYFGNNEPGPGESNRCTDEISNCSLSIDHLGFDRPIECCCLVNASAWSSSSATSSAANLLLLENESWPANCRGVISFSRFSRPFFRSLFSPFHLAFHRVRTSVSGFAVCLRSTHFVRAMTQQKNLLRIGIYYYLVRPRESVQNCFFFCFFSAFDAGAEAQRTWRTAIFSD